MQATTLSLTRMPTGLMDSGDSGAWSLREATEFSSCVLSFDARRGSGLDAAAWVLWVRDEAGSFERVSHGGRVLRDNAAMVAEREALRMGVERLAALLPTKVSLVDFEIENSGGKVQYKLGAQSLRLFGQLRGM